MFSLRGHYVWHFLHKMYFCFTVDKVEHLLKLADEYQTKSVFDLCVNYLKGVPRSKGNAVRILFLANVTVMAREDKRLDGVRRECYDVVKDMALEDILEKHDFKNLERDSLENVLVQRVKRLEELVKEVYPQFIGLVEFCMMLCLESSKIARCPEHFYSDNKSTGELYSRIKTCAVCKRMIESLVIISKQPAASRLFGAQKSISISTQPATTQPRSQGISLQSETLGTSLATTGLFGPQISVEQHLYGGNCHFDNKLISIIKDFYQAYYEITPATP